MEGRGWVVGLLGERCQGRGHPALLLEMHRWLLGLTVGLWKDVRS